MPKLIVVIGVTGFQGSSVAREFLRFPEWRVRGVTRNILGDVAVALKDEGVEIVMGDLDDKATLIPAFEGATAIFSNTDFFGHLDSTSSADAIEQVQNAYHREIEQGLNVAEVASSPEILETLERFIYSSLSDATKSSSGKFTTVYHFDCKAEVVRAIQKHWPDLAAKMSIVQIGNYLSNWRSLPAMAPQMQPDGTYLFRRPFSKDLIMPFVDVERDTGALVKALVQTAPGRSLRGESEGMTILEWIKIWGRAHGVSTRFEEVSPAEFFGSLPAPLRVELTAAYSYKNEFGFYGNDSNMISPYQLDPDIRLTSVAEWIEKENWTSVFRDQNGSGTGV